MLWSYVGNDGIEIPDQFRPRVGIKHIDSKRALKGFTGRKNRTRTIWYPKSPQLEIQSKVTFFAGISWTYALWHLR